jgi:hypothetical protein
MNPQILRVATFALATFAGSLPAQAATLTVDIPGCTALALTGTSPNYQVSCTEQVQSCIVNATPASPQGNTTAQLTVACINPAATAVTWQASRDCATPTVTTGNPLAATVTEPGGRTCVYTATAGGGGSGSTTVVWQGPGTQPPPPPPNAPTGCAITRTPADGALPAAGGAIGMTAGCSGGGAVTSWSWRRNATSGWSTAAAATDNLPANTGGSPLTYTYAVTACAGTACASEVVTTFTVAGAAVAGFCGQYSNVVIVDLPVDTGANPVYTAANGGFQADGVFVGRLVAPASGLVGNVRFYEYGDAPAQRVMSVSTSPCDFRGFTPGAPSLTDPTSTNYPILWSNDQTPRIQYQLSGPSSNAVLTPGQTYYFSVRNVDWNAGGIPSCGQATCNGAFATTRP